MTEQIKKRSFANTAAALVEFDATQPARDKLWDAAESNVDVHAAQIAAKVALTKVREAYHADTLDINSYANCMTIDIQFMRKMAKGSGNGF